MEKIKANDLNEIDCFRLAAAVRLCEVFPNIPVCLVPQQQTKPVMQIPPAIFILTTEIHREKRLGNKHEYQFGINIAYMSKEQNAQTEQDDAAIKLMDTAENIPPLEGMEYPYTMYITDSRTADGIVNVSGSVSVWERRPDNAPMIEAAQTDVNIQSKEEGQGGCNKTDFTGRLFTD